MIKSNIYITILTFIVFAISCKNDPCADTFCGDKGTCVDGFCECDLGYESDQEGLCNNAWANKFVRENIQATDNCSAGSTNAGAFNYNTTIALENPTTLKSFNLFGYGSSNLIEIELTGSENLTIDFTDYAGRKFKGEGIKDGNLVTIDAIITFPNGGGADTCNTLLRYE